MRTTRYYIIATLAAGLLLGAAPGRDAQAQVRLPDVGRDLPDLGRELPRERRLRRGLEETVDDTVEATGDAVDTASDSAGDAGETVDDVAPFAEQLAEQAADTVDTALRAFVPDVSPAGHSIEIDTIVVLVDTASIADLADAGVILLKRRDLTSLGLTVLTLKKPDGRTLPELINELRISWPGAAVDFNHLYTTSAAAADTPAAAAATAGNAADIPADALRVGVIDSAVQADHVMLQQTEIVAADFAMHDGARPLTHGTAVASLVAASADNRAVIYSAGVFFQVPGYAPGATTEGLAAAIDWLVAEGVPVINMSLSGPPNDLLKVVVARVVERGHVIVAAVGNNGPSGEPLYPAAYEGVIGVTAVDRRNKIFRYANRGEHVDFAARGVNVRVADSTSGGLRIESGTSMASPHVTVVIASLLHSGQAVASAARSWLIAGVEDLGRKGFDPVYGHGLVTRPPVVVSAN